MARVRIKKSKAGWHAMCSLISEVIINTTLLHLIFIQTRYGYNTIHVCISNIKLIQSIKVDVRG